MVCNTQARIAENGPSLGHQRAAAPALAALDRSWRDPVLEVVVLLGHPLTPSASDQCSEETATSCRSFVELLPLSDNQRSSRRAQWPHRNDQASCPRLPQPRALQNCHPLSLWRTRSSTNHPRRILKTQNFELRIENPARQPFLNSSFEI